jgi:hypothetical protein
LASAAGDIAVFAPASVARFKASALRSQAVTLKPFLTRCLSIEKPMRPAPTMPTRSFCPSAIFLSIRSAVMRGLDPRIHLLSQDDGLPGQARQ